MVELIYRALLRLHPAAFRERFGGEIMSIFEQRPADRNRLIADSVFSLARQWLLRGDFHNPPQPATPSLADGHMFVLLSEEPALRGPLWMAGCLFSLLSFAGVAMLLGRGGNGDFSIGSRGSSSNGARVQGNSAVGHLDTEVAVRPEGLLDTFKGRAMVSALYRTIRVIGALDANHDLVLSPDEIANAPAALRSLDHNHDGILGAAECIRTGRYKSPVAESDPMSTNPALRALDRDHDGRLSGKEIRLSPASLKLLDHNHDGQLSPEELLSAEQIEVIRKALQ